MELSTCPEVERWREIWSTLATWRSLLYRTTTPVSSFRPTILAELITSRRRRRRRCLCYDSQYVVEFCSSSAHAVHLPTPLPDCLRHVSFRRYSPLSLEVIENRTNVNVFGPIFWGRGRNDPTFLRQIVSTIYCLPFAKVWSSSVWWSLSAKPGNEGECRTYGGWV